VALNENVIKGKWLELKGDIQKAWGKLTDDELEKSKGDMKQISGLIQQKYGKTQSGNEKKLADMFKNYDQKKDSTLQKVKKAFKN